MFAIFPAPWRFRLMLAVLIAGGVPMSASAQGNGKPLRCAVEDEEHIVASKRVCELLGTALHREVVRVADARTEKKGDAIQIMGGDVQWIVAWLRDGKVRAWTRISKTIAQGKELDTITRATRALLGQKLGPKERCVRVDPNGGRRMRSFDLAYPWTELKECEPRVTEVPDPWWREDEKDGA